MLRPIKSACQAAQVAEAGDESGGMRGTLEMAGVWTGTSGIRWVITLGDFKFRRTFYALPLRTSSRH
jgi:hypothetical protein